MGILNLIFGLFMIGMGFLVKSFPNLIAGYNTMPKNKKENVDIVGLSTYMRNSFIIIGLTIISGYYFFKWISLTLRISFSAADFSVFGITSQKL